MENEILNIIIRLILKDEILLAIENRKDSINYPIKINKTPNLKVIDEFNNEYFNKYENSLINNAIVYAIEHNENSFLNVINKNINSLKSFINKDNLFKLKITEYAFKNIFSKLDKTNSYGFFINGSNDETINNNKELFEKVKKNYIYVRTITSYYRKMLLDFLERNKKFVPDNEAFLDELLFTNKLDKFFIFENKPLNDDNIKNYKNALIRLILSDNYVSTELDLKDYNYDGYLDNQKDISNDFIQDIYLDYTKMINDYIKKCLIKNLYILPRNEHIRYEMYFRFFNFNRSGYYKTLDIQEIDNDINKRLELKKINPLYKFDLN